MHRARNCDWLIFLQRTRKPKMRVSNPWTLHDAFINCNNKFCSYWFVSWLAVIFYNCKDHCSERLKSICSCEMKAWKNWSCRCSILINNEIASQQSSLHYLFSRLWVVPIFPQFFAQNSCEENQYLGFCLLAINIPRSLLMTKVITAEWEKESRWIRSMYLKGYTNFTLQNQSTVKGQKLGLCL